MSYYNHHDGTLFPGKIARSEDINQIQKNIADAIKDLIEDQYDNTSFILGSRENDFIISPAPKRLGRYIDNLNLVDDSNEVWLDIDNYGYKQAIKTSKTSLYSVIVKLRNLYSESQDVSFELWSEESRIAKQTVSVPGTTQSAEFEVVFNLEHFSTQHGRQGSDLEKPDAPFVMHSDIDNTNQSYEEVSNPDNQSLGATCLYLVVKAIHKATELVSANIDEELINENTFMICADSQGKYGAFLERTSDDGRNYEKTNYDLCFKSIYSNAPTYLCTGGSAVVQGEPVICHDTHVTVDGASAAGNTKSYITMDSFGQLKSYTSYPYWGDESEAVFEDFPNEDLIIAIIYTYNGDIKQPKIVQDDNIVENLLKTQGEDSQMFGLPIRQRSHHERLRRLEKEMVYHRDVAIPSRLKYALTGEDIADSESKADDAGQTLSQLNANQQPSISDDQKAIDWSQYFISTDKYGNFVIKSIDNETHQILVTLKESETTEGKTPLQLAQTIVSSQNVNIDRNNGVVELGTYKEMVSKKGKDTKVEELSQYGVGTSAKEAKLTEFNPWDDKKANRPETADIKPTTREFVTKKGQNGVNVRSSEYPAMTLYLPEKVTLKELSIPVVKFKNVDKVQFHIWERQGPNNKTNTVWLEKYVDGSPKFSLKNAKTKNGYQILDKPFVWEWKKGLKLHKHQYIILVQIFPKSGNGSVFVQTYKPKDSSDFLIRYHGSADCAHFRLKTRYKEIWYSPSNQTETTVKKGATIKAEVENTYKEGRIESGEVVWTNSEPIESITPDINVGGTGGSVELQANAGNGWKTLTNGQTTKIVGGTSSFRWRAILKSDGKKSPKIYYNPNKKYAINFAITKQKPQTGAALGNNNLDDKSVITTQTFYPGDILQKYIGDSNLRTCDKFSNYEWLRVYAENVGKAKAFIDIAASDTRLRITQSNNNYSVTETNANSCSPASNEYDIFTMYYADLTLDDFVQDSVDYSNYDNNIEYDEHNIRFKIETDKAYNDNDVALLTLRDTETKVPSWDPTKIDYGDSSTALPITTDANPTITIDPTANYLTVMFNDFTPSEDDLPSDNSFIWKYTLPGNSTLDLSKYSALKIGYRYSSADANKESVLKGVGLYISSTIEQEPPSDNYDSIVAGGQDDESVKMTFDGKPIYRYEEIAPETLQTSELEKYKDAILEVRRTRNGVTYVEYYYYLPDKDGIWRRHQYHNVKSFTLYELPTLQSALSTDSSGNNYITISIDRENDNFKYVKEIGFVAIGDKNDKDHNLNSTGRSSLEFFDIKGVIQGYNMIYSASEKGLELNKEYTNHCNTALFRDLNNQISALTRVYYNRLTPSGEMLAYVNNSSITRDANHFSINFVTDTYLPKDAMRINLCSEENGINPIFSLNMPTLNHIYYDPNLNASNLFNANQSGLVKNILNGNQITAKNDIYFINLASPSKTKPAQDEILYKTSIEPDKTVLNVNEDNVTWTLYAQQVFSDGTLGSKRPLTQVWADSSGTTQRTPEVQVKIDNKVFSSKDANTNDVMMADSSNEKFGFQLDYNPGRYKIRVGFQGYSVKVNNQSATEENNKTVIYQSCENEFTVDMYWVISDAVRFAQIYKKINEEQEIKSISISTTDKFQKYMNTVRKTTTNDVNACMHFFVKNMVLHEAEHIPMFHPNVRMKIYSKAEDGSDVENEAVNIRKIGAVIEYK